MGETVRALFPALPGSTMAVFHTTVTGWLALLSGRVRTTETLLREFRPADRAVRPWQIAAVDLAGERDCGHYLDVAIDRHTVSIGETGTLTVKALTIGPHQQLTIGLRSTMDGETDIWPIAIIQR